MKPPPHPMPQPIKGFENIQRFWDFSRNIPIAKIQPGEFYVTTNDEGITTVLGSCVSACIRDVDLGVGGMNHFMLPIKGYSTTHANVSGDAARYGQWAMEYLINQILKAGGRRRMLEIKIFGGGNVMQALSSNIGERNINFTLDYIYNENLNVKAKDVGGMDARIIVYRPKSGQVLVKYLDEMKKFDIIEKERQYLQNIDKSMHSGGDIELF